MTAPAPTSRLHPVAWFSFALGLASLPVFLLGLPALVVGLRTLRAINGSDEKLTGARLVIAGLALAALGTAVPVVGVVAMLLLQVQATSRRAECANHLRQIGVALSKYADARDAFPPATRDPAGLAPERRLSWLADVLPLLAEGTPASARYQKLAAVIDRGKAWNDPVNAEPAAARVGMFHCPGHGGRGTNVTFYVGMAGLGLDAAELKRDDPRAGVFGHDRGVRRAEVEGGISFTVMVLETVRDNGPWLAGGPPTARGLDPGEEWYVGPGRAFGGLHRGFAQALWVDASVRPLADDTPSSVLHKQVTLRRGER